MEPEHSPCIRCDELSISVPDRTLVDALGFATRAGEFLAVLGPNGVGKSLTLHTLAGLRPVQSGRVELDGLPLHSLPRQRVARTLALLPQYTEDIFPATVLDTVMIGRHPFIGRLQWESREDRDIARQALADVGLRDFAGRDVLTLSGGERRRLAVAQVLSQTPWVYLLDEPTNHLDPQHQLDVLRLFRRQADEGRAVLATLHDVNLASRFADRCLLLFGNGRWEIGTSTEVLTADRLSELYATCMEPLAWRDRHFFVATG